MKCIKYYEIELKLSFMIKILDIYLKDFIPLFDLNNAQYQKYPDSRFDVRRMKAKLIDMKFNNRKPKRVILQYSK